MPTNSPFKALSSGRRSRAMGGGPFEDAPAGAARRQAADNALAAEVDARLINQVISSVTLVRNRQQADALLAKCLASESPQIISFLNAHGLNVCYRDHEFANAVLRSDVILRDGIGMQLLFKALKSDPGLNMNGTDLIPEFLNKARGQRLGLLGTTEPYLSKAAEVLKQAGHNVVVRAGGFEDARSYLTLIERYRPRLIVLAMGMPKQELVAVYLKENSTYNPIIINGGAVVDFMAGKVKRAPRWMRRMHMEWVFRLVNEPKRLFRRYVIGNIVFLIRIKDVRKTFVRTLDDGLAVCKRMAV